MPRETVMNELSGFVHDPIKNNAFHQNNGKFPEYIEYYAFTRFGSVGFGRATVFFNVDSQSFSITFPESNPVHPKGEDPRIDQQDLPYYTQIIYPDLYDGIDLVYKFSDSGLKYDTWSNPTLTQS